MMVVQVLPVIVSRSKKTQQVLGKTGLLTTQILLQSITVSIVVSTTLRQEL